MNILAADVGGTKTACALVSVAAGHYTVINKVEYESRAYTGFSDLLGDYLDTVSPGKVHAGFAVAGPVTGQTVNVTNLPWRLSAQELEQQFQLASISLLNDLEGLAWSLETLSENDLMTLQPGMTPAGNRAIIAAGTGLGEAVLHCNSSGCQPFASEGGHCDFAPDDETGIALLQHLAQRYGHVSWERVVSGQGLVNIYRFLLQHNSVPAPDWLASADGEDPAALISRRALDASDALCVQALRLFVHYYAKEAGNLALKANAKGGLFIGGGIAGKILPAIQQYDFIRDFSAKGRMQALLEAMPVKIILDPSAALKGIASYVIQRRGLNSDAARE